MRRDARLLALGSAIALGAALACGGAAGPGAPASAPAQAERVSILRDRWGVPHVFGLTDADTAFGLAWAHAEDDFGTIQLALVAARGRLAELTGREGARNDYLVQLLGVWSAVDAGYEGLSPAFRALVEGYAAGLDFYAARHPGELLLADLRPFTGKDVVAGFAHKLPLFMGLPEQLGRLAEPPGPATPRSARVPGAAVLGSNAIAVAPSRSADGRARLAVNSHQPWEGPVAWYEAHLHSEEGWDTVGGVFPGSPVVLHGHNARLGWAHTVNRADWLDVYRLERDPREPRRYRFDGAWRELAVGRARLRPRLFGFLPWTVSRPLLRSLHGPVLELGEGAARASYALRIAGSGEIRYAEQWYRMNKAQDFESWRAAMRMQALPMFNTVYADCDGRVYYVYNAKLPLRSEGFDWQGVLPGDTSAALWSETLAYDALPQVLDPPSGFLQNANSTPFATTVGPGNPRAGDFPATLGIETAMTERALRAKALLAADASLDEEEFLAIKWDRRYTRGGWVEGALHLLLQVPVPADLAQAQAVLRRWDRGVAADSREAALAVLTLQPFYEARYRGAPAPEPWAALRAASHTLVRHFGALDPAWGEVQRLRRGTLDLPLGGAPDVLHAVYSRPAPDGRRVGFAGDSYVLLASFGADGVRSRSIHVFGSSSRPDSPHFADQAPLFARHETKPVWRTLSEIRANLEAEYHPGEAPRGP